MKQDGGDPEAVIAGLRERKKDAANYSLLQDGMRLCQTVGRYARKEGDIAALQGAAAVADTLLRKNATPSGALIEWDRNTWLDEKDMWRTIPWGVAFCGNRVFEAWRELEEAFTPEQRAYWRRSLENTGRWIYKNPIVGGYVFNAGIDLCGLLWRIGQEFDRPEWSAWALDVAAARIARDIDDEGWIQAEAGGSSGFYQLLGADFLARFAWEAKSPSHIEAALRVFGGSGLGYSTATMDWPGNYGTRVARLMKLGGPLVLAAAAFGDANAAHFVRMHGVPAWSSDLALWRAALATQPVTPTYPKVTTFSGISGTVVREGPWVAYFGNYNRSVWSRGFTSLWHAGHGDWLFATQHSLAPLDAILRAKSRLGDTLDWSGFPHVRVSAGDRRFDSQQEITAMETRTGSDGVRVVWSEPLLSPDGQRGGELHSRFHFHGDEIEMQLDLREIAGESRIDFHFMRRTNGFSRLWIGDEVADIFAGRLLRTGGSFQTRTLKPGEPPLYGVQVDRTVFAFEVIEAPIAAKLSLGGETGSGLHTGDLGGFRFRIELPATERNSTLRLRLRATSE